MKTTFDLPDELFEKSKIAAAKRRISLKKLVVEGLETVLSADEKVPSSTNALERLKRGYDLYNKPLGRDEVHAR